MYYIYGISRPSLLIDRESTESMIMFTMPTYIMCIPYAHKGLVAKSHHKHDDTYALKVA